VAPAAPAVPPAAAGACAEAWLTTNNDAIKTVSTFFVGIFFVAIF
jgi:hypothetical protein